MRITSLTPALLLLAFAGCASQPPEPRTQYLLRGESQEVSDRLEAPLRIGLRRISVAPYLDQAGLVLEVADGQLYVARAHQWAEPLEEGLRSFLRAEISTALGYEVSLARKMAVPRDVDVDVYVDRLHGTMQGRAMIDAGYQISRPATGQLAEYRFSRSALLPREGYEGLVEAEAELARQLARAIAAGLEEMIAGSDTDSEAESN